MKKIITLLSLLLVITLTAACVGRKPQTPPDIKSYPGSLTESDIYSLFPDIESDDVISINSDGEIVIVSRGDGDKNSIKPPISEINSGVVSVPVSSNTISSKALVTYSITYVYRSDLSTQVFNLVNDHRAANGVDKLIYNATNAGFAKAQAEYNAVNDVPNKATHGAGQIGQSGTGMENRVVANIPSFAFTAWKGSAGHNANMLDASAKVGGAAIYEIRERGLWLYINGKNTWIEEYVCTAFVCILDFDSGVGIKGDPGIKT